MSAKYSISWLISSVENGVPIKYLFFWGHAQKSNHEVTNSCLSQWFESPFEIEGVTYKTAEHWMMAQKAKLFDNHDIAEKIILCQTPAEAKKLGRQVVGFDEQIWKKKRYEIVKMGNIHKFSQNPELGEYLGKTKQRVLVEASPVDIIWGIGLAKDHRDVENVYAWRGLNLLGFALMETRDYLKNL